MPLVVFLGDGVVERYSRTGTSEGASGDPGKEIQLIETWNVCGKTFLSAVRDAYSTQVYRISGGLASRESIHRPDEGILGRESGVEWVRDAVHGRLLKVHNYRIHGQNERPQRY